VPHEIDLKQAEDPTDARQSRLMGVSGRCAITDGGQVLMLRRSPNDGFDPGLWELPGGKADYGERLVDAVVRELAEETGLVVNVGRPFAVWHFEKPPFWVTGVGFLCEGWQGTVTLSDEHDRFVWATLDEAVSLPPSIGTAPQLEALVALGPIAFAGREPERSRA